MKPTRSSDRLLPWALRLLWVAVLLAAGPAFDGALGGASIDPTGADVVRWGAFVAWVTGVVAMAVPAPVTLTATRILVPLAPIAGLICSIGGADASDAALLAGVGALATVVAFGAPIGRAFVQASAYGDEERHLLRPPFAYLVLAIVAWSIWATLVVAATVATARGAWPAASVAALLVAAGGWWGFVRWHRLSRRWLVLVPAGLVVHDHLALAETLMLRRQVVALMGLAPAGTDAADLTGPAAGHAIEIRTTESVTAIVGAQPGRVAGSPIHLTGCLVAPTRPGVVLQGAARRQFPVGAVT